MLLRAGDVGRWLGAAAIVCLAALFANAQVEAQNRITQPIDSNRAVALKGTVQPLARPEYDIGAVSGDTQVNGVSIYFKPSAAQQAQIELLLKEQQTPGSPYYHQWLTPAQYASRFGMSAEDLAKIQTWLESQGFTVNGVSASHNRIIFSGTAAEIDSAFQTELHHYRIHGEVHMANSTAISVPAAMAGTVLGLRNLSDFRPKPKYIRKPLPQYTSSITGDHFLAPADFATIYNVQGQYNAGYMGSGKTIAVVGQSAIESSDVANFRSASGLPSKAPTFILVPNTGTSTVTDTNGDEDESDIDVEWSGAIAQDATIDFVYVGNNPNYSVFDALEYAIDNDLAPVVSISYGACEADFGASDLATLEIPLEQANLQGQTVIAAAGDEGAADCDIDPGTSGATVVNGDQATQGLAVDFPGSSPNVTSMGGTEFNEGSGDYWNSSNGSGGASATSYIPEVVWNDTSTTNGIEAGGGGKSIMFGKPSWQTGTGVPADGARDVPDLSLNASPNHDGYLYCASGDDPSSCSSGFRDSSSNLTVAGGTSFDAPTFAGILTLISQQLGVTGQGNVNPILYALAASSPDAFHDITSGNNEVPCESGSPDCGSSGTIGYSAATGYDLASGWGSIDGYNLAQAFAAHASSGSSLIGTTTVLTISTTSPIVNSSITFTAAVSADSVSTTPTGTVQFAVDGTNAGSPVTLSSGSATYSTTFTGTGSHTITATYSGDPTDSASSASLTFTVGTATSQGSFDLSATNVTVSAGSSGNSTITVTPSGGFTGTVSLSASAPDTLTNSCYSVNNISVTGTSAVTTALTIYTSESQCSSSNTLPLTNAAFRKRFASAKKPGLPTRLGGLGATLASVLLLGFGRPRKHRWPTWIAIAFLAVMTLGIGCGGGSSSSTNNESSTSAVAAAGTYTMTVTGTDGSLSNSANFTLTVQ